MFGVDLLHRKVMLLMLFSIFILGFIHLKKLSLRCIPQLRTHSNNKNCSCTVHSLKLLFRVHMQCTKVSISSSSSHRSSSICTDLNECGWVGLQLHSLLTIAKLLYAVVHFLLHQALHVLLTISSHVYNIMDESKRTRMGDDELLIRSHRMNNFECNLYSRMNRAVT